MSGYLERRENVFGMMYGLIYMYILVYRYSGKLQNIGKFNRLGGSLLLAINKVQNCIPQYDNGRKREGDLSVVTSTKTILNSLKYV